MTTTFQFTEKELQMLTEKANLFIQNADTTQSVKENLTAILRQEMPGMTAEMTDETVDSLLKGITTFTDAYREFCQNDEMNLYDRCIDRIKNLTPQEQAACIMNFVAMLKTMDAAVLNQVLGDAGTDLLQKFEEFRGAPVAEDITEEQLEQLREQLRDAIENNAVCLAGEEQMKNLLDSLTTDTELVRTLVGKQLSEFDFKCYVALAAYVACKQGLLETVPEDIDPEILGASVAAGVERARVMADAQAGLISWDRALKLLKYIGGALLFAFFIWIDFHLSVLAVGATALFFTLLLDSSVLGIIAGLVIGGFATYKAIEWFYHTLEEPIINGLGEAYDRVIDFFCTKTPELIEKMVSFWAFLKDEASKLFGKMFSHENQVEPVLIAGS